MRKPRDYDAELQTLTDKAKALKAQKQRQLGAVVISTGADALSAEELIGALLEAGRADTVQKEAWHKSGAAFFQRSKASPRRFVKRAWRCGERRRPAIACRRNKRAMIIGNGK